MITDAQKRAVSKYQKKVYDTFLLRMKKGYKETIEIYADKTGFSFNGYILKAIENQLEKDGYTQAENENKTE